MKKQIAMTLIGAVLFTPLNVVEGKRIRPATLVQVTNPKIPKHAYGEEYAMQPGDFRVYDVKANGAEQELIVPFEVSSGVPRSIRGGHIRLVCTKGTVFVRRWDLAKLPGDTVNGVWLSAVPDTGRNALELDLPFTYYSCETKSSDSNRAQVAAAWK